MAYEEIKAELNKRLDTMPAPNVNYLTSANVSAFIYECDGLFLQGSQACHASLMYLNQGGNKKIGAMADHICGGYRVSFMPLMKDEEAIKFLQWIMDHDILGKSFLEHDAEVAFKERIMMRDLGSLPANVCAFAIIATRALWEGYQNKIPHRFYRLVEEGISPDFAFLLAYYIDPDLWRINLANTGGHSALDPTSISETFVKNFLAHKLGVVADGTIKEGKPYYKSDEYRYPNPPVYKYNVNSSFEDKLDNNNITFSSVIHGLPKIDLETLKGLEKQYVPS